jgi:hypothetical protein
MEFFLARCFIFAMEVFFLEKRCPEAGLNCDRPHLFGFSKKIKHDEGKEYILAR